MREKQMISAYQERGGCKPYEGDIGGGSANWIPIVVESGDAIGVQRDFGV